MKQRRFPRAVGAEDERDRFDGNSLLFFAEGFKIRDSDGFESHDLDLGEYCGRIRLLRMKTHLAFRRLVRGDELPYVAPHVAAFQGGLVGTQWSLFANLTWMDSMRTQAGQGPIPSGESSDAHFVLDVTLHRELSSGLRGFVQARNLTDETYRAAQRPAGARPGMPRSILAGLTWSF